MFRLFLQSLLMPAAGMTMNATMRLFNLPLIRSVWPYDVYVSAYAFLVTPSSRCMA